MTQEHQQCCKKNIIRAEEEQITPARTKQHEDQEEDSGIRPKKTKDKKKKRNENRRRKADRSSEECDARSERLQEEQHTCWRGTYNCCTDEPTRRRGRRYQYKAGGEGKIREQREKHGKKNKTSKQDNKCHCYRFNVYHYPKENQ